MAATLSSFISNIQAATESVTPRSPLQVQIERACNPDYIEPDLALNLEICDIINAKQAS
ncbi:ARF-binding protein [Sorochytrium milnesiophthora]